MLELLIGAVSLTLGIYLFSRVNTHSNSNIPKEQTNLNLCHRCKEHEDEHTFYDAGICGRCGKNGECQDPELISLYKGLGFDGMYVWKHLPRLRSNWLDQSKAPLTMEDIGREIANHISHIHSGK